VAQKNRKRNEPAARETANERRFYSQTKAFGRFGMRIFKPSLMKEPHRHGHVELNLIRNARMIYMIDGQQFSVEPDRLVLFWAGIPHQLTAIEQLPGAEPELCNMYIPLDTFLFMPHIPDLQVALLNGGLAQAQKDLCNFAQVKSWYTDYRANHPERLDIVKMELNAVLRRMCLEPLDYIKQPWTKSRTAHGLALQHVRHVVAMIRHILENLHEPLRNSDVTNVTGLHMNYALALFTRTMNISLKQFIIRMRLLRARGLLLESDMAISTVAAESGFGSASQFYVHFLSAYGTSPQQLRNTYMQLGSAAA
jgi:AraC family transcriptional regulator, melibiose operon regulatory protein